MPPLSSAHQQTAITKSKLLDVRKSQKRASASKINYPVNVKEAVSLKTALTVMRDAKKSIVMTSVGKSIRKSLPLTL